MKMMIYNVFGRHLGVERKDERWLVYRVDLTEGKSSRLYDAVIPDSLSEAEILGWLEDIFHEAANAINPEVKKIH